jgi:hypothetical protein
MIVGSIAATLHGFSRATHDIDIVISTVPEAIPALAAALGDEFYLDVEPACAAVERRDMFNAIHMDSGLKVDFWVLADDEYSQTQFANRLEIEFDGLEAFVASAEDTILSKLLWYRISPSDRQLGDAKAIITLKRDLLDWDYLSEWSRKLCVDALLRDLQSG